MSKNFNSTNEGDNIFLTRALLLKVDTRLSGKLLHCPKPNEAQLPLFVNGFDEVASSIADCFARSCAADIFFMNMSVKK